MRNTFLTGLVFLGLCTPSLATEDSVAQFGTVENLRLERSDWSGFSGVIFVGAGLLDVNGTLASSSFTEKESNFQRSAAFGGSIGYDHQFNNIVLGAHVEGMLTNFQNTSSAPLSVGSKWLSSGTARLGFDAGRFMPYFSAGIGYGRFSVQNEQTIFWDGSPGRLEVATTDTKNAYALVLGGGVEADIANGLFLRADYKHYRFRDIAFQLNEPVSYAEPVAIKTNNKIDVLNLGVGYRF